MAFDGWIWGIDAPTLDRLLECAMAEPARIGFANAEAILRAQQLWSDKIVDAGDGPISLGLPTVELVIDCPGFAPDYFAWGGLSFASATLRAVLALPAALIEYLPVDARRSRPEAVVRDYRVMNPLLTRQLIDLKRTQHERLPVQRADGSIAEAVVLTPEQRQYWRDDFVADAPLFRAAHSGAIVADDALAARVLAAAPSGVAFQDVTSERAQSELVLKRPVTAG